MDFKPCYTWPNPAFPFRLYFDSPELRIFIIENIFHNHEWLSTYAKRIRHTDKFIVILGWHHGDWQVKHSKECIESCGLDLSSFHILCNDMGDYSIFAEYGFECSIVNQNCFLDHTLFAAQASVQKLYKAIYVARLTPFKRHELCTEVDSLALVCGDLHGASGITNIPPHQYLNTSPLTPDEVNEKISQSQVGLILSEAEGACFASSEYLLSGIPVVSTVSQGGRSVWYNEYNSEICQSTPEDVARCVHSLINKSPSPARIRQQHIALSTYFRVNFMTYLQRLFDDFRLPISADKYFAENFIHKMRNSMSPDFDSLFPS